MADQLVENAIQVNITRDTTVVERSSFGVPLFIGETVLSPVIRVATYSSLDEVKVKYTAGTEPEYLAAQAFFSQGGNAKKFKIGYKASGETYTQALDAIRAVDDGFYAIAIQSTDKAVQIAFAVTVAGLAGKKIAFFRSDDADIINGGVSTDASGVIKATNNDYVGMFYHTGVYKVGRTNGVFPEVALLARCLTIPETNTTAPGSNNWVNQQLVGITGDILTTTVVGVLENKNTVFFQGSSNTNIVARTQGGKMLGNEWIDVIHGVAWLESRLAENVYGLITSKADRNEKVPYTEAGIALVEERVRYTLDLAVKTSFLASYTVTAIPIGDTQAVDRANRILKGVTFEARLAGAINKALITGVVSV